jgi:putative transposase
VRPAQRRAAVRHLLAQGDISERHACGLVGLGRSSLRYTSHRPADETALQQRLGELAATRPRFGYRRLHVLLRREGHVVNHTNEHRCQGPRQPRIPPSGPSGGER